MSNTEVTLRTIGGDRDSGRILVQRRTVFPGPGGVIATKYPVKCAFRQVKGASRGSGLKLFLRHLVLKKLDDLHVLTGRYHCPHIMAPYGVISNDETEGYIYQFADGHETFPWEMLRAGGGYETVHLEEWSEFSRFFGAVGVDMQRNIVMPDSRNAQNIIHADGHIEEIRERLQLSAAWYRIDFDEESVGMNYATLAWYLNQNRRQLEDGLGSERYLLLLGAILVLSGVQAVSSELEHGLACYRLSALEHSRLARDY